MDKEIKKLNLGSGEDKRSDCVNIDWNSIAEPDIKHNLNSFPYPFPDNHFDKIYAHHIIEHLDRPFDVMKELHRILKPGKVLSVKVPHFSRGFTHAEHSHGFDITFPKYFVKNFSKSAYVGVEYELKDMKLRWAAFTHLLPKYGYGKVTIGFVKFFSSIFSFLANLSPNLCSRIWCYWVGGFEEIEFKFIVKK